MPFVLQGDSKPLSVLPFGAGEWRDCSVRQEDERPITENNFSLRH